MRIAIIGAAGFIGTTLALALKNNNQLILVDEDIRYFQYNPLIKNKNVFVRTMKFDHTAMFDDVLAGVELVFHLVSTNNPTTSNLNIGAEIQDNVTVTVNILEACKRQHVNKVVFLSSGGTIYGESDCPIAEDAATNPITTYGIQKLAIEKIIYLYSHLYGIDYRIIRLSNPYGPYQRPNGKLGAITTFTYKALKGEPIIIYGDGSNIRDYIFIDDAVNAIINISTKEAGHKIYNVGSGKGRSLVEVLECIRVQLKKEIDIVYTDKRNVDVKENYLDSTRYIKDFGEVETVSLEEGIKRTAIFLRKQGGRC